MAFIAGYVSERPRYATDALVEHVRAFPIVPGDKPEGYEQTVVAIPHGHLTVKHKLAHPVKPRIVADYMGNVLATLGFLLEGEGQAEPKDVLAACVRTGGSSLTEAEGEFVGVFADRAAGSVRVVNDRFAARPCYVVQTDTGTYFASNLAFLLYLARERYRPDVVGWLEAFTNSHTNGRRTTARGVQRLRPGTQLIITPAGVTERRYWRLEHRPEFGLDPVAHSNEVFEAFRAGAERRARLAGRGTLAVSGGLDSRLLVGALGPRSGFGAFTFVDVGGATRTAETDAASAVCKALGVEHRVEPLHGRFTNPAEVISLTGGMRPYHHMAIAMAYVNEIRRSGAQFLLGAGPGDSLAGSKVRSPAYVDPSRVAECIASECRVRMARSAYWPLVFRDDVIRDARRAVADALEDSFAEVAGPTAAHRITAWAMAYRQAAFTLTSVFHTHPDVTEAFAHLDYRYVDLMLRLPATWLYRKAFYAFMIYHALPELRHVPYANTGTLLSGRAPTLEWPREHVAHVIRSRAKRVAAGLGARWARRLSRALLSPGARPHRWVVFGDDTLLSEVQDILHSVPSLAETLDIGRCDRFLANVRARRYPSNSEEILGGLTSMCFSATTLP